jgi:hypothetical protein
MNYELLYNEMVNEIKGVSYASIITSDFFVRDEFLPGFLEKNNALAVFENELRALNDNFFSWAFKKSNTEDWLPMGEFHFISVEQVMKESKNNFLFKDEDKHASQRNIYPFDDHPGGGDGLMACFLIFKENAEIILLSENGQVFPMSLNLQEYLLKSIEMKALYGWQYLFTEVNLNKTVFSTVKSDLNHRLQILHTIFPDRQYNQYIIK